MFRLQALYGHLNTSVINRLNYPGVEIGSFLGLEWEAQPHKNIMKIMHANSDGPNLRVRDRNGWLRVEVDVDDPVQILGQLPGNARVSVVC